MNKIKRTVAGILVTAFTLGAVGCGTASGGASSSESGNPLIEAREKLLSFDYGDVKLSDGLFKETFDACMAYYDTLTADDILYCWREAVGMDTKTGRIIPEEGEFVGWGKECCIAQLISAKARRYAVTGNEAHLRIVKDILAGFKEIVVTKNAYPRMFNHYYYEKTLRALIDIYQYCHLEDAWTMAKDLVAFALTDPQYADPSRKLGDNGQDYGECEWYTMSEALYMFVELATQKGESAVNLKKYRELAEKYEYKTFWDIFYNSKNIFDYTPETGNYSSYFHAYSHLNSFNSALEAYELTGKDYYLDATLKFYDWFTDTQKYATGGYGNMYEWLLPAEKIVDYMTASHSNSETQCNSYAGVNMSNRLMRYTAEASYGDWVEEMLYNMTISSLETVDGKATYYSDYNTKGGAKSRRNSWPWACCTGTRPLVVMEYLKNIWFNDTENLYVNLYTNSSVKFERESGNEVGISQQSSYPESDTITFTLSAEKEEAFSVSFRKPDWLAAKASLKVNGSEYQYAEKDGWIVVNRAWKDGDKVELQLPMNLYFSSIEAEEYENYKTYAVKYGPVVLACEGNRKGLGSLLPADNDPNGLFSKKASPLTFALSADESFVFKPYYEYAEGETYILYIM